MFNPVSWVIFSSAGTTRTKAEEGVQTYLNGIKFELTSNRGIDLLGQFTSTYPKDGSIKEVWEQVAQNSFRVQVIGFVLSAVGLATAGYKLVHRAIPSGILPVTLAVASLFVAVAARKIQKEAIEKQEQLDDKNITKNIGIMRREVIGGRIDLIKDPWYVKCLTFVELQSLLNQWIANEEKHTIQPSNSTSIIHGWRLGELRNPKNEVMKAILKQFVEDAQIKRAIAQCEKSSDQLFDHDFLEAYKKLT